MRRLLVGAVVTVSLALSGCGGGGGGDDAPSVKNTAEGFWSGTSSAGYNVDLAILENGETWGVYASGSTIFGALQGTASGSGSSFNANGTDYNFTSGTATAGSITGTVTEKSSIRGTSSLGPSVSLTYQSTYDRPASLSELAGTYSFIGRSARASLLPATVAINANGAFSLIQSGCTSNGSFSPRPSGKNIFDVSVSFSGPTCALGNGSSAKGIAYLDTTTRPFRLSALALRDDRNDGLIVLGTKR